MMEYANTFGTGTKKTYFDWTDTDYAEQNVFDNLLTHG